MLSQHRRPVREWLKASGWPCLPAFSISVWTDLSGWLWFVSGHEDKRENSKVGKYWTRTCLSAIHSEITGLSDMTDTDRHRAGKWGEGKHWSPGVLQFCTQYSSYWVSTVFKKISFNIYFSCSRYTNYSDYNMRGSLCALINVAVKAPLN